VSQFYSAYSPASSDYSPLLLLGTEASALAMRESSTPITGWTIIRSGQPQVASGGTANLVGSAFVFVEAGGQVVSQGPVGSSAIFLEDGAVAKLDGISPEDGPTIFKSPTAEVYGENLNVIEIAPLKFVPLPHLGMQIYDIPTITSGDFLGTVGVPFVYEIGVESSADSYPRSTPATLPDGFHQRSYSPDVFICGLVEEPGVYPITLQIAHDFGTVTKEVNFTFEDVSSLD
jgi:hypothetical protein